MTNKKNKDKKKQSLEDKLKYEIAEELGLTDKIDQLGWGGLTARESGRIGGLITVRKRKIKEKKKNKD